VLIGELAHHSRQPAQIISEKKILCFNISFYLPSSGWQKKYLEKYMGNYMFIF
jgi:hypothetical protein